MPSSRARELFDIEQVEVKDGVIQPGRMPRSRFFVWNDPRGQHDLIVFIGEAQPPVGKFTFCQRLIEFAMTLGVERVYTFAALATQMNPARPARVFVAATDSECLAELKHLGLETIENGQIGGLEGVLLGVAAEHGIRGACLMGEMPHVLAQLPSPKASLAILEAFGTMADLHVDYAELAEQVRNMEQKLGEFLEQMQKSIDQDTQTDESSTVDEPAEEEGPSRDGSRRIEQLFTQAKEDRATAYELKRELDRLGVFREYENRFLDLFKKPE